MNKLIITGEQEFLGKYIPVIEGGFGEGKRCLTDKTIAEIHHMRNADVRRRITDNINRFKFGIDIINLKDGNINNKLLLEMGYTKQSIRNSKHTYLLSERGYAKLSNIMTGQAHISNQLLKGYFQSNIVPEPTNTKEYYFYEQLSEQLSVFDINDCEVQYHVLDYKVDMYIPSLNIAIEYDENNHKNYTYEAHELRQKRIEKELKCTFIRVTDEYSINIACAIVINKILNRKVA